MPISLIAIWFAPWLQWVDAVCGLALSSVPLCVLVVVNLVLARRVTDVSLPPLESAVVSPDS